MQAFLKFDPYAFLEASASNEVAKIAKLAKVGAAATPALAALAGLAGAPSRLPNPPLSGPAVPAWAEADEERAAIIEYDACVPREWAEALARLDPNRPPGDVPLKRWRRFIDDCGIFLDDGWEARAIAIGWGPRDLFGCDRERPFARVEHAGLVWLLGGDKLADLRRDSAVIDRANGARQTYRRRPFEVGRVVLAWELC
ncbi:MAG: hypothetical protein ACREDM_01715 [Methylocella sp.]